MAFGIAGIARDAEPEYISVESVISYLHRKIEERSGRGLVYASLAGSLALHLALFLVWDIGRRRGLWESPKRPTPGIARPRLREVVIDLRKPSVPKPEEARPATFVDVPVRQATTEPPPKAEFYSSRNSKAANPDVTKETGAPKIEGKQEVVPKAVDVARRVEPVTEPKQEPAREVPKPPPSVPPPPTVARPPETAEPKLDQIVRPSETPPKPVEKPMEVGKGTMPEAPERREPTPEPKLEPKPEPKLEPKPEPKVADTRPPVAEKPPDPPPIRSEPRPVVVVPPTTRKRPRTLAQVRPDLNDGALEGEKMRQAGGVSRFGVESSFDVRSTEFGAYDQAIVSAIQKRWYDLLDSREIGRGHRGRVVLVFRLYSDGRIGEMNERENEVTPLLGLMCRRAVEDPAPYAPWPSDLRRLVGRDFREVRFVFHYN